MNIEPQIKKNTPLAQYTTFKIGGPAKFFIEIENREELIMAVEWAKKNKEKFFILAGGSNILVNDDGVEGLVAKINNRLIKPRGERLDCGAGAILAVAVSLATSESLTGLEWASGIPGSIGGAIRGNAGAYALSMGDVVETIEVFDKEKLEFKQYSKRDCEFGYRESIFKNNLDLLIWQVILKLKKGSSAEIKKEINEYSKRRLASHPKLPSPGCVFKNIDFELIKDTNSYLAEKAIEDGAVNNEQVSAGWLIDLLGFKGKTIGGAKISLEHANFIVNTGKAKAEDVVMLSSYIKQQVRDKYKIQLQEEIQYLGF